MEIFTLYHAFSRKIVYHLSFTNLLFLSERQCHSFFSVTTSTSNGPRHYTVCGITVHSRRRTTETSSATERQLWKVVVVAKKGRNKKETMFCNITQQLHYCMVTTLGT